MKKIITLLLFVGLLGFAVAPVLAVGPSDILKELQDKLKNLQDQFKSKSSQSTGNQPATGNAASRTLKEAAKFLGVVERNITDIAQQDLKQHINLTELGNDKVEALIKAGTVSEISSDGTLLKVKVFNLEYKVQVSSDSKLVRNYWGASEIAEFSVGDIVNVHGYLADNDPLTIVAKTIRNVSIQKLHASFTGEIKTITPPGTFTFETKGRGTQTVTVGADTKIFFNKEVKSFGDLQTGMKALVRGIWNKTLSKIQALLVQVKPAPTLSPSPTPTPTATATVSPTPTPSPSPSPTPSPSPSPTPSPTPTP